MYHLLLWTFKKVATDKGKGKGTREIQILDGERGGGRLNGVRGQVRERERESETVRAADEARQGRKGGETSISVFDVPP